MCSSPVTGRCCTVQTSVIFLLTVDKTKKRKYDNDLAVGEPWWGVCLTRQKYQVLKTGSNSVHIVYNPTPAGDDDVS